MRVFKCPKVSGDADCSNCPGVDEAIAVLRSGGLVVFPTDTVYGLAGIALDQGSVETVFMAKGRPGKVPMPVAVPSHNDIPLVAKVDRVELGVLHKLQDGPITWVLPAKEGLPELLHGGRGTIGVRVLGAGCAFNIALAVGPITATSANVHGEEPPRTAREAQNSLGELVALYIDSGETDIGVPTTVVEPVFEDGRVVSVRIIREGAINGTLISDKLRSKG